MAVPEELEAFCDRVHDDLVGALSLYCGDGDVARELAQEALVRACRDWERVREMTNPSGWAYRVAINLANSHFRRRAAERRAVRRHGARRFDAHRDADVAEQIAVRRAVAGLPERMRTALVLRFYAEMSTAEIAEQMGIKEASVRATVGRAVDALGDALSVALRVPGEESADVT